jgi:inosose dehydratase
MGTLAAAADASALFRPLGVEGDAFASMNGAAAIRLGYAAITWGSDGRKAIEDISAVGFHGIQLRADAVK